MALKSLPVIKPLNVLSWSAASFKETRAFFVRDVNDVIDGIIVSQLLKSEKILFSDNCKDSIAEFGMYAWDEKSWRR